MSPKKIKNKKNAGIIKIKSLITKDLNLNKIKINPIKLLDKTKGKIENFYETVKKQKEINRKKAEKQKKNR